MWCPQRLEHRNPRQTNCYALWDITEGSDDNLNTDEHNLGMTIAKNKYIFSKMLLSI
jgi:hypothetical protein